MRLFEPDLIEVCWECGDALGDEDIVPASCSGYWSHTPCDLEAACEADAPLERPIGSVTGGQVEGPYSARFPSSPAGETSREAIAAGHSPHHGSSRHEAVGKERPIRRSNVRLGPPIGPAQAIASFSMSDLFRFMRYAEHQPNGCVVWTGVRHRKGYGRFSIRSRWVSAHRVAYIVAVGPVPEGMELDHLCRNRPCVNPAHLEPVTTRENTRRAPTVTTANASKTSCVNGHVFDERNTRVDRHGYRRCRACDNRRSRKRAHGPPAGFS